MTQAPTQGDWQTTVMHAPGAHACAVKIEAGETLIAAYSTWVGKYPSAAECEANARLMGAAPQLLAEVRQCVTELTEAVRLLAKDYPRTALIYEAAAKRALSIIATVDGKSP
jgi:hypothetical protein